MNREVAEESLGCTKDITEDLENPKVLLSWTKLSWT
jgi:hypothetical protein